MEQILYYGKLVSPFNQSKVLIHSERLLSLTLSQIVAPICCEIDLSDGFCNNKCPHCFFTTHKKDKPVFFDIKRLPSLLAELRKIGVKAVEFSGGGEPTTHPQIKQALNIAVESKLDIELVTNGLLLDKIVDEVKDLTFVRVSLDAATDSTYRLTHGVDSFRKVLANIRLLANRYKNKIGVAYLIQNSNIEDISDVAKLAKELGCRFIQYRPVTSKEKLLKIDYIKKQLDKAKSYSDEKFQVFDAGVKWKHIEGKRFFNKCYTHSLVAVIKATGDVPFCILKRNDSNTYLGNVNKQSFSDIFFSNKHFDLAKQNDISYCMKPCKHDSYNIAYLALSSDLYHKNFI